MKILANLSIKNCIILQVVIFQFNRHSCLGISSHRFLWFVDEQIKKWTHTGSNFTNLLLVENMSHFITGRKYVPSKICPVKKVSVKKVSVKKVSVKKMSVEKMSRCHTPYLGRIRH